MVISELVRKNIRELKPFSSARSEFKGIADVWLDANENPYDSGFNRYPDPYQKNLKKLIGEEKNIDPDNIFIGNGSDEIIDLLIRTFCEPRRDGILYPIPSFSMYQVMAEINDVECMGVPLNQNFDLDTEPYLNGKESNAKIIFLCSPNNPTGNCLSRGKVIDLLNDFEGLVVIDEAYIDFANQPSCIDLLHEYPKLVILQTFSKAHGAAGLRVGMSFANREVVRFLNKVKAPYNVGSLVQKTAIELWQQQEKRKHEISSIKKERERLFAELPKCPHVVSVFPSEANFLLVRFVNHNMIYRKLIDKGIVVRDRSRQYGCENCLRLTVGSKEENDLLLNALM